MIGRLRGELIYKKPPQLMLDVNGVGYELEAPMSTFYELPEVGANTILYTHLLVREDAHTLYAFSALGERALFRALLKVNGVGAKMALALLSGMSAEEFARAVLDGNTDALVRLPGVGKKTAERLIVEMRDRVTQDTDAETGKTGAAPAKARPADPVEDAVQALIALGYKPQEASRMIGTVAAQDLQSDEMIRLALKAAAT